MVVVIELEAPTLFGRPAIVSMPTPIGHALGGIAAGVVIVGAVAMGAGWAPTSLFI